MASLIRRAGAEILRTIARTLDPSAEDDHVLLYAKAVGGTPQMFVRSPDFGRQISGLECNIWDRPLTRHALDDEFESTTLDAAWTIGGTVPAVGGIDPFSNPGAVYELHTNRRPSWLMIQPSAVAETRFTKDISSIAGDFSVWMRGSFNARFGTAPTNNDASIRIDLSAAVWDANNRVSIVLNEQDAGTIQVEFFEVEGGVATGVGTTRDMYVTNAALQGIEAVGIQKIGTTFHGWAVGGSGQAIWIGSTTFAGSIASATIGAGNASTASPGTMILGCDYIRFVEGAVFLP